MIYAKFLTSPYPNAKIKSMDTSRAEAYPGVRGILRYDDPELPEMANLGGHVPNLVTVLPRFAYFQGEEVGAMVAADTESIAEEALKLIEVEWEERPFVLDEEKAAQTSPPGKSGVVSRWEPLQRRIPGCGESTEMWRRGLRRRTTS